MLPMVWMSSVSRDLPALDVLLDALPTSIKKSDLPLHYAAGGVTFGRPDNAIDEGRFHLDHIISTNPESHSITLTSELQPGGTFVSCH